MKKVLAIMELEDRFKLAAAITEIHVLERSLGVDGLGRVMRIASEVETAKKIHDEIADKYGVNHEDWCVNKLTGEIFVEEEPEDGTEDVES